MGNEIQCLNCGKKFKTHVVNIKSVTDEHKTVVKYEALCPHCKKYTNVF